MKRTLDLTPTHGEMLKPRELIDLNGAGPLTLQDRRVFNELVQNAWGQDLGNAGHWFEIDTVHLHEATYRSNRLGQTLERLMRTICTVTSDDGLTELRTPLLSSNELKMTANGGTLRYKITEEMAGLLKDSTIFAKLDKEVMRSFSSKYAYSLYEAVARRVRMRQTKETFTIDQMRDLLGVESGKLSDYKNLNTRAIQPALTEVNAMSDLSVGIFPIKEGRTYTGFVMGWNRKSIPENIEATKERGRHHAGRYARHKDTHETIVDRDTSDIIESQ
jgi:plasmid replication initiation protein